MLENKLSRVGGGELCQAQNKLGLAKPALPIEKLGSSSNCKNLIHLLV